MRASWYRGDERGACAGAFNAPHVPAWGAVALRGPHVVHLLQLFLLLLAPAVASAQTDTVVVEQRILMSRDVTPGEAKRRAIDEALAEAARRVAGVRVRSTALSMVEEREGLVRGGYSSVVQLDADARAVAYDILDDEWITVRHPELGAQLYYRARLAVEVARERGTADAGFAVDVTLDADRYRVRGGAKSGNDEIVATVRSTRTAHLTVFAITGDSAEVIFPNAYVGAPVATASRALQLPPEEWRARGLRLRVSLPAGVARRHELLMIVATLDPVPPPRGSVLGVLDVQRWLVSIDAGRRAVGFAEYEVVRR